MKYNRLTAYKIKKIMIYFCEDLPASKTANLLEINLNTINNYYNDFRMKIFDYLYGLQKEKKFKGDVELDESYFGAKII
jgi:hypothetical protein